MKNNTLIIIACFLIFALSSYAQPSGGGPSGTPAPIDGGIGFLIAAAALYGSKKLYDKGKTP